MICNQLQNRSGFFVCMTLAMMEITQNSLAVILTVSLAADLSDAALGKSSAVYGHIDENGLFVRKWPARKIPITDKMVKNSLLSVKIQPLRTRFYGQTLQKHSSVRKSSS